MLPLIRGEKGGVKVKGLPDFLSDRRSAIWQMSGCGLSRGQRRKIKIGWKLTSLYLATFLREERLPLLKKPKNKSVLLPR